MKKTVLYLLAVLVLCLSLSICVCAAPSLLSDGSHLLSASESAALLAQLEQIQADRNADVVIVTTDSLNGKTARVYADDFYDENGYQEDGVLLLVCMTEREWYVTTSGACIDAVSDAQIDALADRFLPELSAGNYSRAFASFASGCDRLLSANAAGSGTGLRISPLYICICIAIGVIVASITTAVMKGQLKTVAPQPAANSYLLPGSLQITQRADTFLYRRVTRVPRPKDTDSGSHGSHTHTSASGHSHGGHGGKF